MYTNEFILRKLLAVYISQPEHKEYFYKVQNEYLLKFEIKGVNHE